MNKIDLEQYAIVSDFDGTISIQDSNALLFEVLGNADNHEIEKLFKSGKIGTKEGFLRHFEALKIDEDTYTRFVQENIHIDKSFIKFYRKAKEKAIPLIVVSGGFINAISLVFNENCIDDLPVYANRLVTTDDRITAEFAYENMDCKSDFGACGNCKVRYLNMLKGLNKKVIFIGDGLTDRCAADEADIVFAKGALAEYCTRKGIEHIAYNNFDNIYGRLFS